MKKVIILISALLTLALAGTASAVQIIMIGDNDGYGYGSSVVADGAQLPYTNLPAPPNGWNFDNRSAAELADTNGAQYTDWEPYSSPRIFTISFDPAPTDLAKFIIDYSGIQRSAFGASTLLLDGVNYSSRLNQEQGAWGSTVTTIWLDPAVVNFAGW